MRKTTAGPSTPLRFAQDDSMWWFDSLKPNQHVAGQIHFIRFAVAAALS
jgi:hypothetical protein